MTDFTTYWINLEKSVERKENMEKFFNEYNIKNKRINAVYGKNLNELNLLGNFYNNKLPNSKNLSAFGCVFSHYKTIKYFLENDENNFCLILEDDIDFSNIIKYNLNYNKLINKIYNEKPIEAEIIQMCVICGGNKQFTEKKYNKYFKWRNIPSTAAYIINKNGAKKFIEKFGNNNKFNIDLVNNSYKYYLADVIIYKNLNTFIYKIPFFNLNISINSTIGNNISIVHIKAKNNIDTIIKFYENQIITLYPKNS